MSAANASTFSPATTPSTLTREQRVARFVDDDLTTFAMASAANAALFCAKEFFSAQAPHRLRQALVRTRGVLPVVAFASALGVAGMKLSIAVVTHTREDYTRSSVLLAFPVAGALLRMHGGPRAMAVGALGFGALGYGADQLFAQWHRRNASLEDAAMAAQRRERAELVHFSDDQHQHHHHYFVHHHHRHDAMHLESLHANAHLFEANTARE